MKPTQQKVTSRPQVALIIETSINYGRGLLKGVARYMRSAGEWSVFLEQRELGAELPRWIDRWDGDGIITRSDDPRLLERGIPTVALFDHRSCQQKVPQILNDNRAVGRLAAAHLVERGFRHLAFYGVPGEFWSEERLAGVREEGARQGASLAVFEPARSRRKRSIAWQDSQEELARWMSAQAAPLGLVAANDIHGLRALDACKRAGISVPERVAVMGADNDEELCELSDPPLSSIAFQPLRAGFAAAEMLARMMRGERVQSAMQLVPPLGLVTRQSTDVLAMEDEEVARALAVIRQQACDGLDVPAILRQVPISRRSLEIRMQKLLGRTPREEIRRVQIERAKKLLSETDLKLDRIAVSCGFVRASALSIAFREVVGTTPSDYRSQAGLA
ncbi:transcriptional regulator, AraC family [Pirellula staleyi DSM 6068]|uniref:Transcriptional regulator, AraC family n=1 Tax=Pirellula staleyi (strain ATCC 27377 / DSM 6068 / ICPB 4128) TaxID=530564 RepID=D2R7D2_PIRSD|nr:xylose operon transcription regulator XylR [Pirellula staleyi]ADB15628.1 transcriptional regulator, AraC family [Pirellula staleyi DSM 6068]